MSFRIISAVSKSQVDKVRDKFKKQPKRIDVDLPLGIRLDGMMSFDMMPFIITKNGGSIVDQPEGDYFVQAYGCLSIDSNLTMHRFYLNGKGDFILRVIVDKDGLIVEDDGLILFQQKEVITPSSAQEWDLWIGNPNASDESFWIGWEIYGIGDQEDPLYFRTVDCDFENESPDEDQCYMIEPQIEPLSFTETVYTNSVESGVNVPRRLMIYARDLGDEADEVAEHCTVSSVEGDHGGYVEVLVGVPLSKDDITII